jgi:hypothetical protein
VLFRSDAPIPEPHAIKIRFVLRPDAFNADGSMKKAA